MQFFTTTMLGLGLITLATSATLPITTRDLTTDTNLPPMKWVIPGKDGGENITLYGEASSIITQYKNIDALWEPTPGDNDTSTTNAPATHDSYARRCARQNGLGPPVSCLTDHLTCCPVGNFGWGGADAGDMNNAINQLGSSPGYIYINGHSCGLVSAWWSAGIWVCNDSNDQYQINPAWVQGFIHSMGNCFTCGQSFSASWSYLVNVIVHHT